MKRILVVVCLLLLLLFLTQSVLAMSSAGYRIDWNNLVSGGGGPASSASYKMDFTVWQTGGGASSSPVYQVSLGYWAWIAKPPIKIFLPTLKKQ